MSDSRFDYLTSLLRPPHCSCAPSRCLLCPASQLYHCTRLELRRLCPCLAFSALLCVEASCQIVPACVFCLFGQGSYALGKQTPPTP